MNGIRLVRNVKLGIKTLLLHKMRSFLTVLGVVFGVGSVIAMLAVGEGASAEALEQIRKLGSNNIIIESRKPVEDSSSTQVTFLSIYGLLEEDYLRIAESFDTVSEVVPVKEFRKEGRLGTRSLELRVVGTTPGWFNLIQRDVVAGRVLLPRDTDNAGNSVVLTEYGARRLLATQNVIGQNIRIGGDYFEVIGIVESEGEGDSTGSATGGSTSFQTPDQQVDAYIPFNLARAYYGDTVTRRSSGSFIRERVELHNIIVQVEDIADVEPTAAGITAMLERFHKKKDYQVTVPLDLLRQAEATKRMFNIVLGSIAGISLLVGGIGIMNIMLASVTERTREIGIRRAIGARKRQIVGQFLIETVVLSTIGGLIGVAVGFLFPRIITLYAEMPTIVTPFSLVLSLAISMGVGIVFGIYPAMRAANLDPIVALRHE